MLFDRIDCDLKQISTLFHSFTAASSSTHVFIHHHFQAICCFSTYTKGRRMPFVAWILTSGRKVAKFGSNSQSLELQLASQPIELPELGVITCCKQ